jgi:hypothetical protein
MEHAPRAKNEKVNRTNKNVNLQQGDKQYWYCILFRLFSKSNKGGNPPAVGRKQSHKRRRKSRKKLKLLLLLLLSLFRNQT